MATPLSNPKEFLSALQAAVEMAQDASRSILDAEQAIGSQQHFVSWADATESLLQLQKVADQLFASAAMRWGETPNGKELRNASRAA